MEVIAGKDEKDATTTSVQLPPYATGTYTKKDLTGIKIGLISEYLLSNMSTDVKNLIWQAANKFKELGATVEEVSLMDPKYSIGVYTVLQRSEVSSNLARFDGIRFGESRGVFNEENKRRIMLGTYTLSAGYYDAYYKKAQAVRTKIIDDFNNAFKNFDCLIGAVSPGPALSVGASKNEPMLGEMEDILVEASSIAGLTSASVPCGFVNGLPIGLQITSAQHNELKVLQVAECYQKNTDFQLFPNLDETL
jgi:aspartyl-tRNA(Asn)/glutamyl-tRNA(Gln) amidotransferase subunit A